MNEKNKKLLAIVGVAAVLLIVIRPPPLRMLPRRM